MTVRNLDRTDFEGSAIQALHRHLADYEREDAAFCEAEIRAGSLDTQLAEFSASEDPETNRLIRQLRRERAAIKEQWGI